jgi:pimeloyl-ACP methyl ester carboxylesterase
MYSILCKTTYFELFKNQMVIYLMFVRIAIIAISFLLTSCFGRFVWTDAELDARYKNQQVKPVFEYIDGLHYAKVGSDTLPWLVLVHGAPGAWYVYMRYLEDSSLYNRFHVIAVDRPGYGKSGYGKKVLSIEEQAKRINKVLDKNSKKKPIYVIGRSYGCPIAVKMASLQPDINGIMLLSPAIDPDLEKFWWFSRPAKSFLVRWALPKMLNVASFEKFSHVKELRKMESDWGNIHQKTIVFQGLKDNIVSPFNAMYAKRMLKNNKSKVVLLENSDHFIASKNYELVIESLNELVSDNSL